MWFVALFSIRLKKGETKKQNSELYKRFSWRWPLGKSILVYIVPISSHQENEMLHFLLLHYF